MTDLQASDPIVLCVNEALITVTTVNIHIKYNIIPNQSWGHTLSTKQETKRTHMHSNKRRGLPPHNL